MQLFLHNRHRMIIFRSCDLLHNALYDIIGKQFQECLDVSSPGIYSSMQLDSILVLNNSSLTEIIIKKQGRKQANVERGCTG
jgi:hypothetical protein